MNYKYIALGGLIGFLFAVAPSCSGDKSCSAATCAGCCDSTGACQTAQTAAACGASGSACVACTGNQTCQGGICTGGTAAGGGAGGGGGNSCAAQGKCTKPNGDCGQSCSVGCCIPNDPFGTCSNAINNTVCGKGGELCQACTGGAVCTATTGGGQCTTPSTPDSGVGAACTDNATCVAKGTQFCKKTTTGETDGGTASGTAYDYPAGYCTQNCGADGVCPDNADCLTFSQVPGGLLGESEDLCFQHCDPTAQTQQCRNGYTCLPVSQTDQTAGDCFPDPPAPDNLIGAQCDAGSQCGPPPLNGFCNDNYPNGGMCSADCSTATSQNYCGTTGLCIGFSQTLALCYPRCGNPDGGNMTMGNGEPETPGQANCRAGYVCTGGFNNAALGACSADCRSFRNPDGGDICTDFDYECQTTGAKAGYCCKVDGGNGPEGCQGIF